jgi:alpha-galactosidase
MMTGLILPLLLSLQLANAVPILPKWFGDNMILQTNSEYGARSFLNGKADPSEIITFKFNPSPSQFGDTITTVTQADGTFDVQVYPSSDFSQEFNITVSGSSNPDKLVIARHVKFGDVFFCSGQSNMVFPLNLAFNATEEAATLANYPNFRFFHVQMDYSSTPQFDLRAKPVGACKSTNNGTCNKWVNAEDAAGQYLLDFSAVCFMTVRNIVHMNFQSNRPMALVLSAWGGTRVEAWMSSDDIKNAGSPVTGNIPKRKLQNQQSVLYNAMVAPFDRMSVRGMIWYQGEANADQAMVSANINPTEYYSTAYQSMIYGWRDRKKMGDFAVMTMQLPPSVRAGTAYSTVTGRQDIRLAEQEAASHAGGKTDISGTAIGIDLGGSSAWGIDHPPNKNEMSRRLALQALHVAYAQQSPLLWTGPIFYGAKVLSDNKVVLMFDEVGSKGMTLRPVKAKNIDGTSNDCTMCCTGGGLPFEISFDQGKSYNRVPLQNINISNNVVTLSFNETSSVTNVRYAWSDYVDCVLDGIESGLPAGPFVQSIGENSNSNSNLVEIKPIQPGQTTTNVVTPVIQRPPMGFNSWNYYHCNIDENTVKAVADAMSTNGMKDAGYEYINIDDCWQVKRFPNNTIQPDPVRFPSGMKSLSDYVHSKGLKFGVYTARGSRTCQGRPGAYQHELLDASTYCDWGLDYLKDDNCGGAQSKAINDSWIKFRNGFNKCQEKTGRGMVLSVEYCTTVTGCGEWVSNTANLWRTTADVQSTWVSVMNNIHENNQLHSIATVGHYNDPDMLQIGNIGLTVDEQYSQMSLWCIAGAPLLAGTDIIHMSKTTSDILTNSEVTAINQDEGWNSRVQGFIVRSNTNYEVWVKRLADGKSWAALLLNLNDTKVDKLVLKTSDLNGYPKNNAASIRDLWSKKNIGDFVNGTYTSDTVAAHGSVFLRITAK